MIFWFEEVDKNDTYLVGGKGANLGEMINAGFPIPYGFIVTANAYFLFLDKNNLRIKISQLLKDIDYENPKVLHEVSKTIKKMIIEAPIPEEIYKTVAHYYDLLPEREIDLIKKSKSLWNKMAARVKHLYQPPLVAIRSSATAEDLPEASFAGQQETYLNIRGEVSLLKHIKFCWASLFGERSIYYRYQKKFSHDKVGLAAVVQKMVESDKSGIAFTVDPISGNKRTMVIEAIYGLGEYIVGGKVNPDHYEIDKQSLVILKKQVAPQKIKLTKKGRANKEVIVTKNQQNQQKLSDEEIIKVAITIAEIEKHYYFPQDIEWAIEGDQLYIVQSRPITTLAQVKESAKIQKVIEKPLLIGAPASPGIATGPVKILNSAGEIDRIKKGDVLVASQTNPDYVPAMKKAVAIVTDRGGRTSHAAIVSRELGIPAVVGTENATKILKDDQMITVNGQTGEIYLGKINFSRQTEDKIESHHKTKTKLYVNLAEVDEAKKVSKMDVDGVGLLRAEFMIAEIGIHPKTFIKNHHEPVFINKLSQNLLQFARSFTPRPVIYRATDFKTNEYRHLKNGSFYEPNEENPMLGYRGAIRYISDPTVFRMELLAIKKVWQYGFDNLHLMIPFVRTPWELIKIKQIINQLDLFSFKNFKLYLMVEVPACALKIEDFLKIGVDGLSIGSNDLTMMLLGLDRDNSEIAHLFDERSPVVLEVIKNVIDKAKEYQVPVSICGQAPSDYPELVEELVKAGITSLSVNPDAVEKTREIIFQTEKKFR